jgi:hypothetical protein
MKRVLIVVVLVIIAAIAGLMRAHSRSNSGANQSSAAGESMGDAREEIRKSYQLSPNAQVTISGINGKVDIQTSETDTAEVYVLRTANSRESLDRRRVVIEQTPNSLTVRTESNRVSFWARLWTRDPKEEVTIKAPRRIALLLKGINGRVNSGEVDGAVEAKGINGRVELGQVNGSVKVSGINGSISAGLKDLDERGVQASGINGSIELRIANGVNADLVAKGMNGRVRSEIPEVIIDKGDYGSSYSARIGTGGAPINVSGINGNVLLTRLMVASDQDKTSTEKKSSANAKSGS